MKYIIATLALIIGLQADAMAQQHHRKSHHRHAQHHHRQHGRTFYRTHNAHAMNDQPSPYKGDNTPINDGQRKNKQRNMNYNNGQPLPPNNGGR